MSNETITQIRNGQRYTCKLDNNSDEDTAIIHDNDTEEGPEKDPEKRLKEQHQQQELEFLKMEIDRLKNLLTNERSAIYTSGQVTTSVIDDSLIPQKTSDVEGNRSSYATTILNKIGTYYQKIDNLEKNYQELDKRANEFCGIMIGEEKIKADIVNRIKKINDSREPLISIYRSKISKLSANLADTLNMMMT